jgi:hypothetical protein
MRQSATWGMLMMLGLVVGCADKRLPYVPVANDDSQVPTPPKKLDTDFRADKEPLEQVLQRLAATTDSSLQLNRDAIRAARIALDTPVSVHFKNARISTVLRAVMKQSEMKALGYTINGDYILVTTRADLYANHVYTRQYNARDLLRNWRNKDEDPRTEAFKMLIKETVDPESWDAPGTGCSIKVSDGILTINQTFENLRDFENLLEQLRDTTYPVDRAINFRDNPFR